MTTGQYPRRVELDPTRDPPNWFGTLARRALTEKKERIEKRQHRSGRMSQDDAAKLARILTYLAEIEALRIARLWADEVGAGPLDLVRKQMTELHRCGLTFDCIGAETLLAVAERRPGWLVGDPIVLAGTPEEQRAPEQGDDGPNADSGGA